MGECTQVGHLKRVPLLAWVLFGAQTSDFDPAFLRAAASGTPADQPQPAPSPQLLSGTGQLNGPLCSNLPDLQRGLGFGFGVRLGQGLGSVSQDLQPSQPSNNINYHFFCLLFS